ncbi:MAG: alpha-amylase [Cyanobacteria bacterium K_Offshore_surface_m2_239]|nr:alpha-amylase [Cyanobacteria bacterium K_Offshore_surface_m2_239]
MTRLLQRLLPLPRQGRLVVATISLLASTSPPAKADVILHAFGWSYGAVAAKAQEIAASGYKAVLLAPPLKSARTERCDWWQRYQPQDFRTIDNCDGNKESFKAAIEALRARGVRAYADVVVNHLANERDGATTFPGPDVLADYKARSGYWRRQILYGDTDGNGILDNGFLPDAGAPAGLFSGRDLHPAACILDYSNSASVLRDRICGSPPDTGLPDLKDTDPAAPWVSSQRKRYIQALYDLGVRGFRLDAAKHMPTAAIRAFVPETVARNSHIFAEIITSGGTTATDYQQFLAPYLRALPVHFGAYDFPLLHALRQAFAPGRPLSALASPLASGNALENGRAVTVVVTHDIPYNAGFRHLIFDPEASSSVDEDLAYAYILGRDGGTPLVLDDQSAGRANNGRWRQVWNRPRMRRLIAFHNRMQGKSMEVLAADACSLLWRRLEDGIVAINKCAEVRTLTVDTRFKFKWNHPYRDHLTGRRLPPIQGPRYTFRLPARSAQLWSAD